ncbi:MAG: exodeoxyribonuclease VII large subunit [Ilumatobacteraceae bacterium]
MTQQSFQFDDAGTAAEVDDATAGANGSEVNGAESTAAEATEAEVAEVAVPETLSIGEAIRAVNEAISSGVGGLVWVRGELHNTKIAKGHRYFDLVDDAAGNADVRQRPKVSAQLFANAFQRIQPRLDRAGVKLAEGLCVRMRGTFEVYALSGRFNFRVVDVDPEFTLGNLAMQRDALMRSLAADGVLDANSSRPMPLVPLRIGVVASGGSEGWHDFRTNLEESGLAFVVELAHARVQGAGAPMQVARHPRSRRAQRHRRRRGGARRREQERPGDVRPRVRRSRHRRLRSARDHRHRARQRPQRRRRGRTHRVQDAHCLRAGGHRSRPGLPARGRPASQRARPSGRRTARSV